MDTAKNQPCVYEYWKGTTNKPLWDTECISLAIAQAGILINPLFMWRRADNALLIYVSIYISVNALQEISSPICSVDSATSTEGARVVIVQKQ